MTLWAVHVVTYNQGKMILTRKELGAQLTFTGISVLLLQNWLLIMLCSIYYCYACFYTSHVYMYIEISISFLCLLSFMKVDSLFSCNQAALWMVHSVCLSLCLSVRLSVCPSVCLSGTPFSLCSHHHIIMKFDYNDTLPWRHNECDSVSNHQPPDCLLNCLFRRRSNKKSKLRIARLCVGSSPMTGEFTAQMASYVENVSIWWHHHEKWCPCKRSRSQRPKPNLAVSGR